MIDQITWFLMEHDWDYYRKLYAKRVFVRNRHAGKTFEQVLKEDRDFCINLMKDMHDIEVPLFCTTCSCEFDKKDIELGFINRHNEKMCKPKDGITCYYCGFRSESVYFQRCHDCSCEDRKRYNDYIDKHGGIEWYMRSEFYENMLLPYRRQLNKPTKQT